MTAQELIRQALAARERAYAPYSGYRVGAALLCADGAVFLGCNVENAAYSLCNCAERTALYKAVSEGRREFAAIAVVGGKAEEVPPFGDYAYPCGACRQALYEFAPGLQVVVARDPAQYREHTLDQLLPHGFGPENLI